MYEHSVLHGSFRPHNYGLAFYIVAKTKRFWNDGNDWGLCPWWRYWLFYELNNFGAIHIIHIITHIQLTLVPKHTYNGSYAIDIGVIQKKKNRADYIIGINSHIILGCISNII